MFATLDTSSRRLRFPREREVIVTDTVGFIRNLPSDLVAAFKATLEELSEANLFLHVIDASSEDSDRRIKAVRSVLSEIGLSKTPELLVWNKCDCLSEQEAKALADRTGGTAVSALSGNGMGELLRNAEDLLWTEDQTVYHRWASSQGGAGSRQ
jgi:GTP-binding protein HflX